MNPHRLALAVTLLFALALAQAPSSVTGVASVIDGDTLEIRGVRVRLYGVDAPESSQLCLNAQGKQYRCGAESANRLAAFLGQRTVTCVRRDTDRYGRMVGVCTVGTTDVNEWLVRNGLAVAYVEYSRDYVAAERAARAAKVGIWAGTFQMPWEYRANPSNPPSAGTPRPSSPPADVYYANCAEARAAGAAPIYRGQPGYRPALDRDGDGVACE